MPEERLFAERELKIARVLRPLGSAPMSLKQAMLAAELFGIHWGSVYRLRKQFLADPVVSALKPKPPGPKRGRKRLNTDVERVIHEVLASWLPRQPELANPLLDIWTEIRRRCRLASLPMPGRNTVARRWREHQDAEAEALAADPGSLVAPGTFSAKAPLDVVQIDHTQSDIEVVDRQYRRSIGRPWLTVAIDIAMMYRPVGRPHFGGHVERMNRTLMERLRGLPGSTGNSTAGRPERRSAERAALTLEEFEQWLCLEAAQRYHNRPHRGLMGASPASAWSTLVQTFPPRQLPGDAEQALRFLIQFMPMEPRTVQNNGLTLFYIRYWHPIFATWREQREQVTVRYHPEDLSRCQATSRTDPLTTFRTDPWVDDQVAAASALVSLTRPDLRLALSR